MVRKSLRDYRRAIVGWSVGLGAWLLVYMPWYPVMRDEEEMGAFVEAFMESVPEGLTAVMGWQEFATGPGYLHAMVYGLYVQVLFIMAAIVIGVRALAGPEEAGTLELLIAHPVDRRRFVLDRCLALLGAVFIIGAVVWVVVAVLSGLLEFGVGLNELAAANVALMLNVLCYGMLAIAAGAATGRRSIAMAVAGAVAAGSFAINTLSGLVGEIEPLRWISTFHYALDGDPLRNGFQWGNLGVLAAISLVLAFASVILFARRDVGI